MSDQPTPRIFLYSHLRTRSNLLMRLLETHPKVLARLYPFKDAFMNGPECQNSQTTKEGRAHGVGKTIDEFEQDNAGITFQSGLDAMEQTIADAESQGRVPIVKEHTCYLLDSNTLNENLCCQREEKPRPVIVDHQLDVECNVDGVAENGPAELPVPNPTILPDRLAITFVPVFITRHPAYTFPSALRASSSYDAKIFDPDFSIYASFRWQRLVFDFYRRYFDTVYKDCPKHRNWPIVVDGDALVNDTKDLMTKFCEMVGLDDQLIQYSWDPSYVRRNKVWDAFTKVCEESTGVIKTAETIKPPDLEVEMRKWAKEWDECVAQKLKEFVELAMDDYEYLLRFSLKV